MSREGMSRLLLGRTRHRGDIDVVSREGVSRLPLGEGMIRDRLGRLEEGLLLGTHSTVCDSDVVLQLTSCLTPTMDCM